MTDPRKERSWAAPVLLAQFLMSLAFYMFMCVMFLFLYQEMRDLKTQMTLMDYGLREIRVERAAEPREAERGGDNERE